MKIIIILISLLYHGAQITTTYSSVKLVWKISITFNVEEMKILLIPFNLQSTELYYSFYDDEHTQISPPEIKEIDGMQVMIERVRTKLTLPVISLTYDCFNVLHCSDNIFGIPMTFPLGFNFKNLNSSIVHRLYQESKITSKQFAFDPSPNGGQMYFGKFDPKKIQGKFFTKCSIPSIQHQAWGCSLSAVKYSTKKGTTFLNLKSTDFAYLQASHKEIYATKELMDYLKEVVFKDLLEQKLCEIEHKKYYQYLICQSQVNFNNSYLFFHLDGADFEFEMNELLETRINMQKTKEFLIMKHDLYDRLELGTIFLKKYFTVFDYDSSSITFYQDEAFKFTSERSNAGLFKIIVELIVFLGIMGIIILLYAQYKK